MPYPWECSDCAWLDTNDCRWGDFYCKKNRYYVDANSPSCRHFEKRNSSSNSSCYLTTLMCNILGYEDNCVALDSLRAFRDNYMKNDDYCNLLLDDYDIVGPMVCEHLENDSNKVRVAHVMLTEFITPAIRCIREDNYDDAIEIYKNMTIGLMNHYGLDTSELACSKTVGVNITRKREI